MKKPVPQTPTSINPLEAWRGRFGWTRTRAAAELGLHQTTYRAYETGSYWDGIESRIPRYVLLAAAALAHGIPPIE
jgi:hypothetical protein